MSSTALVFMMVPGIALFYSGLRSQAAALPLIWLNMMAVSIVSVQVCREGFIRFGKKSQSGGREGRLGCDESCRSGWMGPQMDDRVRLECDDGWGVEYGGKE